MSGGMCSDLVKLYVEDDAIAMVITADDRL